MQNLNKNIKIFFVDLDGTLLDIHDKNGELSISKENINQIKETSREKEVVISTGRPLSFVKEYLNLIEGRFAVVSNGALVVDYKGKIIRDIQITVKQTLLIWNIVKKYKLIACVDGDDLVYGVRSKIFDMFVRKIGRSSERFYNLDTNKKYHKFTIWCKSKKQLQKALNEINNEVKDLEIAVVGKGFSLELTYKDASKMSGNLAIANLLKVKPSEIMHIGDSMNDASTVKRMRLVAMKNSNKKLKELTSYHGPHYKKGGVAKVLRGEYRKI